MIGVGKLGQDCAEVMADAGYDVVGYDIEPRTPAFRMCNTIEEAVKDRDFIFIAAPTPHDPIYGGETPTSHLPNKDFDYTIVTNILTEVNKYVNKKQLVVLISTVLPGTVRNHLEPCITNARFIYNPYLIAMGTIKWDMVNPEMVIIGTEDGSTTGDARELIDFYRIFMENNPRYEVGTWDEAEAIKIFYNTFISTKLALVNMIQDVAETNGNINVDVVTQALAKSTHRIMGPAYMKAALGDAGACHPRDNIALRYLAERLDLGYDLFDSIMTAREVQAERMALRCLKNGKKITIIGKAYKPGVPYTNGSASMLVGYYIEKHGGKVNYYDRNTGDLDLKEDWTDVFLIGYWEDWMANMVLKHMDAVIIDPWRKIGKPWNSGEVIYYGDTRKKEMFCSPVDQSALKNHSTGVYLIWPELEKHDDKIYIVDTQLMSESSFYFRPTEIIVKSLLEAKANGKSKFLFYLVSETMMPIIVRKIQRIASIVSDVIDSKDIFYLCGSPNGKKAYDKMCKEYNWESSITVLETNCNIFSTVVKANTENMAIQYEIKEKSKDFLCFNKVPRKHRLQLLDKMLETNVINRGYYSFHEEGNTSWLANLANKKEYSNIVANKHVFPMKLNMTADRTNPVDVRLDDLKYFDDSYFSVVTETTFYSNNDPTVNFDLNASDCVFISEKTHKCFVCMHPFVLLGNPGSLTELRKIGYKTFSPMIDESYDLIENDTLRFEAVWKEINRLLSKTPAEWLQWQTQIKEIVEHNRNHILTYNKYSNDDTIEHYFID